MTFFNCDIFGHYASECHRPRRNREEANLTREQEDELALLMAICEEELHNLALLNEDEVAPTLSTGSTKSSLWYLDNGTSNHMTGEKSKFKELDEKICRQVQSGDGSMVHIKGKGSCCSSAKTVSNVCSPRYTSFQVFKVTS